MFNFIINKKIPLQQKIFIFISSQLANCNQIQHMLIQFERPECPKHKRPFQFLCMTQDCPCQIRLCAACINSHCKKYGKSDFMKDGHFYKKLQMQCEIIDKQYSFLEKHFSKEMGSSLLSNKKQENFKMVELIMKVVSQDEKAVKRAIDQFCFSVEERRQKISSLYNTDQRSFLKFIQFPIPMQIMIKMASNKGLERIWKKIIECQGTTKKYKQILQELQRYGNTAESFYMGLRFRKVLLKDDIKKLINHSPTEVTAITNEIERRQTTVKRITNNDQNTKKLSFTPNPYAASPRSPRKFTIFSNENRPRTNTNLDRIK